MPAAGRPLLAALFVVSCSVTQTQGPVTTYETQERVYHTARDVVWGAVLETLTDLDIPVDYIETASGFVRSDYMTFRPGSSFVEFFDCGSYYGKAIAGRSDFDPQARFTVLVQDVDNGRTEVRVRMRVTGTVQGDVAVHCVSIGTLEDDFYRQLAGRVGNTG
jgi:hypothetical protein